MAAADQYKAKNAEDPPLQQKMQDLVTFAERSKFCMMTSKSQDGGLLVSRAMALAGKEGNGIDLIFHSNTESGKNADLSADPKVNLAFVNSSGEWASISGNATIDESRSAVHEYYSPTLRAWMGDLGDGKHDGGPDDPRICIIKVKAVTATYAVSSKTVVGSAYEVAKGVITGEAPEINSLRYISEKELSEWRASGSA